MLGWASSLDGVRRWGVEGAWNYGRGLSQHLLGAGEEVYEVNPRWTAEMRKRSRKRGKSDRLDARAVAELVWREGSGEGTTAREALRALKRYIVRAIWRLWRQCRTVESSTRDDGAAASLYIGAAGRILMSVTNLDLRKDRMMNSFNGSFPRC